MIVNSCSLFVIDSPADDPVVGSIGAPVDSMRVIVGVIRAIIVGTIPEGTAIVIIGVIGRDNGPIPRRVAREP